MDGSNDLSPEGGSASRTEPDGHKPSPALDDPASLTAEERRLQEAPDGRCLACLGALSQRAPVGDGSRRLQRQRRRLVVFQS